MRSTGCGQGQAAEAERALAEYIANKYRAPRIGQRDPAACKVADVIAIYAEDVAHKHTRPRETAARLGRILDFFGETTLACINRKACEDYVRHRGARASARRELEDLRAAVRHHWEAGLCAALTPIVLPERGQARERWLTRGEAARLLWAAWRLRQRWRDRPSDRTTAQHIARFILIGLYTGTRAGAICGAALMRTIGRGYIDLDAGVFYRRATVARETERREPPGQATSAPCGAPTPLAAAPARGALCDRVEWRVGPAHQQGVPVRPAGGWLRPGCGTPHTEAHGHHMAGPARGAYARDLR